MAGVMTIDLVLALLAGQHDFFGVDDDDIVAIIDVRGVGRFVLAAQPHRHQACEAADHEAGGVDDDPFLLDLGGLGRKGFHDTAFRNDWRTCLAARGSYTRGPAAVNAVLNIGVRSIVYLSGLIIPLLGGIEYVEVTWATGSVSPCEQMVTSPVASRLPSLRRRASATRSRGAGLRKKLMLRLMVTANGTGPTAASTATYIAKSASAIMVGPEIVPPGRSERWRKACRTRQPCSHTASIARPLSGWKTCGNSARKKCSSSSTVIITGMRRPPRRQQT